MLTPVTNDRWETGGGVADVVGQVVEVVVVEEVVVEEVVVEVPLLPEEAPPAAAAAPAGVPMAMSVSSDVTPTSAGALHRRCSAGRVERLWRMDVIRDFTGVGSFGS